MTPTAPIHRRDDGSIDTDRYIEHARELRSRELQAMIAGARCQLRRFMSSKLDRLLGEP